MYKSRILKTQKSIRKWRKEWFRGQLNDIFYFIFFIWIIINIRQSGLIEQELIEKTALLLFFTRVKHPSHVVSRVLEHLHVYFILLLLFFFIFVFLTRQVKSIRDLLMLFDLLRLFCKYWVCSGTWSDDKIQLFGDLFAVLQQQ